MRLNTLELRFRLFAAGLHFLISIFIAALSGLLVFKLWYPWPYYVISGGKNLFLLVVSVDVVMGPILTFVVFDNAKRKLELVRDLSVIVFLQLSALAYGLNTVFEARPVALVFEVDRFRTISASDVFRLELADPHSLYHELPKTGPWVLGTRNAAVGAEKTKALELGLEGFDTGQRPLFWQPYDKSRSDALKRSRSVNDLLLRYPDRSTELRQQLAIRKLAPETTRFLPLVARVDWVVLLDNGGSIVGFADFNGFF